MSIKDALKEIQLKIGTTGIEKLYQEAKRRNVPGITKEAVKLFLATDESKQLFKPLPQSKGLSGSEAEGFRVQMDLIDMKYSPSRFRGKGPQFKYVLVIIDVMSRFVWTGPLINKEPASVEPVLRRLINGMDKAPVILSSDKGLEFTGVVDEMLEEKDIIHRSKSDKFDMNALSVVDRVIQTLKKRLAENLAANKGQWVQRLHVVTKQYNNTQHPTIRGEPAEFGKVGHEVAQFMTEANNAKKLQHNQQLLEKRKEKLADEGGFRVPIGASQTFQRGFKQRYTSDVKVVSVFKGSVVEAEDGTKVDVKRALPVHAASGYAEAGFALGDQRIQNKKDKLIDMMTLLMAWADEGERTSVSAAATHLRREMGTEYKATLKKTGFDKQGGLALAIRLFDHEFEVESGGYYFKKV
jgi:hypothetical protein